MSEFITSLYVDSRFRSTGTGSDFVIELPENLACASNTVAHVAAVSFPVTFWTVEAGVRDRLAIQLSAPDQNIRISTFATLQPGQYDGFSFQTALKDALDEVLLGYALPKWDVLYVPAENRLVIQWGDEKAPRRFWRFISERQLREQTVTWTGAAYDPFNLHLIDSIISLEDYPEEIVLDGTYVTGYFDSSAGISVAYLHSTLASFRSVGPQKSARNVIARVPIEAGHGSTAHWVDMGHTYAFTPVYNCSLARLSFSLCDAAGRPLDLHGGDVSLHIRFHDSPNGI